AIIINEKAVQVYDLGTPAEAIGKILTTGDDSNVIVIGVVKDFYFRKHFENPLEPLALFYRPEKLRYANICYFEGKKDEIKASLPKLWKKFDKIHSVEYTFLDEEQEKIESDMGGTIAISAWGCGFIIIIALLGLLGMAMYTCEMRVKEIGIRKVLGASISGTTYLLSKGYIKLILYSAAFALPSAYFLSDGMFQFFAIRPGLSLWVPFVALIFILGLALITITSQTVKVALTNPVNTLREE
ncbi:MAG: ABC transporter permease, partial [Candidatus Hodarchaeota archaeon]